MTLGSRSLRMLRNAVLPVLMLGAAGFLLSTSVASAQDKPKHSIKEIMEHGHKGDTALIRKATTGKASKEELQTLAAYYKEMSELEPPKGDKASWKTKTMALVTASEAMVKGEAGAVDKLKAASNCRACHTAHRPS